MNNKSNREKKRYRAGEKAKRSNMTKISNGILKKKSAEEIQRKLARKTWRSAIIYIVVTSCLSLCMFLIKNEYIQFSAMVVSATNHLYRVVRVILEFIIVFAFVWTFKTYFAKSLNIQENSHIYPSDFISIFAGSLALIGVTSILF